MEGKVYGGNVRGEGWKRERKIGADRIVMDGETHAPTSLPVGEAGVIVIVLIWFVLVPRNLAED